jgi:hypothetical protein
LNLSSIDFGDTIYFVKPGPTIPTFIKTAQIVDLGSGTYRLSNNAEYKIRLLNSKQAVGLTIGEAGFSAKALRELASHLTALAAALDATA